MTRFLIYVILTLFVLFALKDFVTNGYFKTHDGEFHIVRLMHFDSELNKGQFPVRFSRDMMYGYGSPVFTYFYPQIYYWGSLIHRLVPTYSESLKAVAILASVFGVLFFYEWLRKHFSQFGALIGTMLFIFVPYRFVVTYVTGAHQVLLSLMWVSLLLLSINGSRKQRSWLIVEILAMAGLITSHNVTALIFSPLIFLYIFVLEYDRKKGESWKFPLLGLVWGIALSASFLIPALFESKLVFLGLHNAVPYTDHWPTLSQLLYSRWGYGFSNLGGLDGLSFQLGIAQWVVVGLSFIFLKSNRLVWLCSLLFAVSFLMMLPISDSIWKIIPIIQQIQFPWRILILETVLTGVMAASLAERMPKIVMILVVILAVYGNRNYLRSWERIRYSDADYVANSGLFNGTTDIAGESLPRWVESKVYSTPKTLISDNKAIIDSEMLGGNIDAEMVSLGVDTTIELNRYYFPSRRVMVDGITIETRPSKAGTIEFPLTKGKHLISVRLIRTPIEMTADFISIISLVGLVFYGFKKK